MPLNVGELQASMNLDISRFTRNMNTAKNELKQVGTNVRKDMTEPMEEAGESSEEFAKSLQEVGEEAAEMRKNVSSGTQAITEHKTETKAAAKSNEEWKDSVNSVKKAWGALKGALGAVGIVTSVTAIISKMKEFIEECQKAEKEYTDFINNTQMLTASSVLSSQIETMSINALKGQTAGKQMFTYDDYAKAMTGVSARYPELLKDETALTNLSESYLRFANVMGTDVSNAITQADAIFKGLDVDVSEQAATLDYLYKVSAKVQLPLSDLVSLLKEGDNAFKLMGYSTEEAANYIAAVYNKTGKTDDISTMISNVDKLTKTQYSAFGSDEEMSAFIQKVMSATEGMTDQNQILNRINEVYNELYPTLKLDEESGEVLQVQFTEMAATMQGFAKLSEVTTTDISNMSESVKTCDIGLMELAATSTQTEAALKSINSLWEKDNARVSSSLQYTYESAKAEAMTWEGGYLDYWKNAKTETAELYRIESALRYKDYNAYLINEGYNGYSQDVFNKLQENKNASTSVKLEIVDNTRDGIAVSTEANRQQITAANNPTISR